MAADSKPQLAFDFEHVLPSTVVVAAETAAHDAIFRPIHYLGSKLRVLQEIIAAVEDVAPAGGAVLDLFAGSGTVAMALARRRPVYASDIQEYSRVICGALLAPSLPDEHLLVAFEASLVEHESFRQRLRDAIAPAVRYEEAAIKSALLGDPEPICDLLDHGSLLALELGAAVTAASPAIRPIREALRRLKKLKLAGSAELTALRCFGGA